MKTQWNKALAPSTGLPACMALAATLAAGPVAAQTAGATVNVSATVNSQCNVLSPSLTMAFGAVDVLASGGKDAPVTLRVQCNKGAAAGISADNGGNFGNGTRRLTNGTDTLGYSILQPTGATFSGCPATIAAGTELGSTALDVRSLWTASGGPRDITLCGRLETPQESASGGSYTDTVTITVSY